MDHGVLVHDSYWHKQAAVNRLLSTSYIHVGMCFGMRQNYWIQTVSTNVWRQLTSEDISSAYINVFI